MVRKLDIKSFNETKQKKCDAALASFAVSSFPVSGSTTVALLMQRDTVCPSPSSPYLVLAIE